MNSRPYIHATEMRHGRMPAISLMWGPCLGALMYLLGTLLLFKWGPVDWPTQNDGKLWTLNALYLAMFVLGYAVAMSQRHRWSHRSNPASTHHFCTRFFWPIWMCAALVVVIGHRNLTLGPSYIPTTVFSDFVKGLEDPLGAYLYKLSDQARANFSGNSAVTLLFGLLAFTKPLLTYVLVTAWPELPRVKRWLAAGVVLFPMVSGVCVGTNKPLFDVAFMLITIVVALALMTPENLRREFIRSRRQLLTLCALVLVFAVTYFHQTMNARAPGLEYAKSLSSTAAPVNLKPGFQAYCEHAGEWEAKGCHLISIGTIYLTQGYHGMSLSVPLPLETTYGLGHSKFIIDSLYKYLAIDLAPRTFQYRIHTQWSATGQWHSAYSQWANDVGFWGVGWVMLALGFYVGAIWTSAMASRHPAAVCSIPLLVTMIAFLPANNQVFNIFESLASFTVLLAAWLTSVLVASRRRGAGTANQAERSSIL
jgi:hypothetical protein